jgi:hypothetical protein
MAKYYVQSGTLRTVVQAESSRNAAIWAVHQAMQQVLPIEGEPQRSPAVHAENVGADGIAVLSRRITVSERGFNAQQVTTLPTLDVISEWNQLVTTLDRLEQMLHRAA